jgi:hypothetical protein
MPRSLALSAQVALVLAGLYNLAPYYTAETKPRWDLAAAYLGPRLHANDVVVTNGAMAQYVLTAPLRLAAVRCRQSERGVLGRRPHRCRRLRD